MVYVYSIPGAHGIPDAGAGDGKPGGQLLLGDSLKAHTDRVCHGQRIHVLGAGL